MSQVIDLKSILALEPSPSIGPPSAQASIIHVRFVNIGNLTACIDIPEVAFKLDLMPGRLETCSFPDIDLNKAYSLKFSLRDSAHEVVERYVIRYIL